MNQMDENYWKQLAQDWIKRQHQNEIPTNVEIPEAPKISGDNQTTNYDNLAVADMDIEDAKDEPVNNQIWNSSNNQHPAALSSSIQSQTFSQHFPVHANSRFQKQQDPPKKNSALQHQPLVIPDPPSMSTIDQINTVDMEMDDSDNDSNSASSANMMEIQKRKKLPAWIREGIEKMKREKELEESRIQEELKRKEDENNRKQLMEEALKEIEREKITRSKYESSDSENEETELPKNIPHTKHKTELTESDGEAYENMMLLVRKTLTSLLLEVTDEIIQEISNETVSKYRKKASATTKPALIKLGLAAYSSSTDEEESGDENAGNSDWESESVLKERIQQKQFAFEKRMKEKIDKQQAEMEEEKLRRTSSLSKSEPEQLKHSSKLLRHSDSDDDKFQKSKNTRKDGEEKYETMIYSISTSSGPITRVPREKKTRFSDPKDGRSTTQMTHLGMVESSRAINDNGTNIAPKILIPPAPIVLETQTSISSADSPRKEKKDKKKRRNSTSSSSSSDSEHRKKHKKHKKSSKHSKKSSKKKDRSKSRSRSRDRDRRHNSSRSDRHSIESKSSIRSSESRRRSRSRSKSRDRHRRRY